MKISKLFHWLYAILMFLPFGFVLYNALTSMWSGQVIDFNTWFNYINAWELQVSTISMSISDVYIYLVEGVFGLDGAFVYLIENLLTYWTCISIIWLIFDVFMYVPLLCHKWIDKAKIE